VVSLSCSPLRRAELSITRTLTPRRLAAMTAFSNDGSENTNILTRSVREALSIAVRIG